LGLGILIEYFGELLWTAYIHPQFTVEMHLLEYTSLREFAHLEPQTIFLLHTSGAGLKSAVSRSEQNYFQVRYSTFYWAELGVLRHSAIATFIDRSRSEILATRSTSA
jgi:hypothetical protein